MIESTPKTKRDLQQIEPPLPEAAANDRTRLATLMAQDYSGLLSLIRRKLKNRELAADLVNEAIAITLEHQQSGRVGQPEQLAGYVFKVSMNLLRNHQRNFDNRQDLRSSVEELERLGSYERDELESAQLRAKTRQLLESLPSARDRQIIKRFYLEEADKQVICNEMGLTPLQFAQVISRARQRMKAIFESQGGKRSDFLSMLI